jgi:hypothetical protein
MSNFAKIVVVFSFLFLIGFAALTVVSIARINGEYLRDFAYKTDPTGVYQIVYPAPNTTLRYGRLKSCTLSGGKGHPTCAAAWKPACKKKAQLVAQGRWPLTRTGKVSQMAEDVPVFRYGPRNSPKVLVVQTASCLLEYPRAG